MDVTTEEFIGQLRDEGYVVCEPDPTDRDTRRFRRVPWSEVEQMVKPRRDVL